MTKMNDIRGRRILLDPLGGLYRDDKAEWRYQRKPVVGVPGDIITSEISSTVYDLLRIIGADIFATRCMRRSHSEIGKSQYPLFHESASHYLRYARMRPSLRPNPTEEHLSQDVWGQGKTCLEQDQNARINFARHIRADIVVAINITNYVEDDGLEIRHNGVGGAAELADGVIREVSKRTRRKPKPVAGLMEDEQAYAGLKVPVAILDCGSAFDPASTDLLRKAWYRELISRGVFAGIFRNYCQDQIGEPDRAPAA